MKYLFIANTLGQIGGIETLIARMSNWLISKGNTVTLLTDNAKDCRQLFNKTLNIVDLGSNFAHLCFYHKAINEWAKLSIDTPDVIKAFDLTASWIASILSTAIKPTPKLLFGNYFPYVIPESNNPFKFVNWRLFLLNIRWNYNDESILCMSEEQIAEYKRNYGNEKKTLFWPLPVEDPSDSDYVRSPQWGRIVSVGRLERMKEYNIYMIDVIENLQRKGYQITWTVYGVGNFAELMRTRIDTLGLSNKIELKGRLDYNQYASAMKDAHIFVGMGTSIIEAALCGVPSIVALAHDSSGVTYGPLYNFPFGNCGELTDTEPNKSVENEIERLLQLTNEEYERESIKTREYAKYYNMENSMNRFLNIVNTKSATKTKRTLFYWYYVHRLFEMLRNSLIKKR